MSIEPAGSANTNLIQCRWCREPIASDAKICKHCKKHQNFAIEYVYLFGGAIGVVTLVAGIISYLYDDVRGRINAISEPKISLVDYNSKEALTVHNDGRRKVYVAGLFVDMKGPFDQTALVSINKHLDPGELHTVDLDEKRLVDEEIVEKLYFMGGGKDVVTDAVLERIRTGSYPYFEPIIYFENNVEFRKLASAARVFDVNCTLEFTATGSADVMSRTMPCKAVAGFRGKDSREALCRFQKLLMQENTDGAAPAAC